MSKHHTESFPAAPAAGFTLIELLLVVGIIGMLAVAFLPDLFTSTNAADDADTQSRMRHLQQMVDSFERAYGMYPPDELVAMSFSDVDPAITSDGTNTGIEALVIYTHQKRGNTNLVEQEIWLGNTDGDKNKGVIPLLKRKEKMEVVDAWGTPLAYFLGPFDAKKQQVVGPDGITQTVTPWKNPRSSGYIADDNKYMLVSAGLDGVFNTDDDLTLPDRVLD